jgi:hypothetical protein
MSRDVFLFLFAFLTVGCNPAIEETFPPQDDFCGALGRELTDRERLEMSLAFAYDDESLYYFQQFKAQLLAKDSQADPERVIAEYLDRFPDCCAVLPPAYLREEWELPVIQVLAENGTLDDWNRDVKIARRPKDLNRFDQLQGTFHWHKRMNACGEIMDINRG